MNAPVIESVLTAEDRCDSCGAAAQVIVTFATGDLYWCLHHYNKVKEKVAVKAVKVHDESGRLYQP